MSLMTGSQLHLRVLLVLVIERSRYVTLPWYQNFWMITKQKRHLKSEFALFET